MKKFYLTLSVVAVSLSMAIGQACTIDQNNTDFFNPTADNVPCAEQNVVYDQTLQLYIPTQVDMADYGLPISFILTCDSVVLDSITGLPNGLNWSSNPVGPLFLPGTNACGKTLGTTTDPVGNYPIVFHGLVYLRGNAIPGFFDGDTTVTIQQFIEANQQNTYSIDVIAQGDPCRPSSINSFSAELNAALSVYPNPNSGVFELKLNATRRVNGEIVVVDVTGRRVFTQSLDAIGLYTTTIDLTNFSKGLYTVQLRTGEGFASKTISVE